MAKKKDPRIFFAVLFIAGFVIIVINAAVYLGGFFGLSWEFHLPSTGVGVAFLAVGMYLMRMSSVNRPAKRKKP